MKQTTKCMELSLRQQGDTEFWNSIGLKMPRILYSWAHLFLFQSIEPYKLAHKAMVLSHTALF